MNKNGISRIDWLDPIKAFALFGVILNHLIEGLEPGSWFTKPSGIWVGFLERVPNFVGQDSLLISTMKILAWIGDFSPGVFILASGFGLTWTILNREQETIDWKKFLQRRVLRLFPLYIFLHLLFLAATLAKSESTISFADPNFLLSILGIRTTDTLFFYINPSWWFIWLILQLYIVFPLLYILLRKLGVGKFLLLACFLTFVSRLSGLLGFRYSESLYFWMLGIFFGTRLAEFCAGMALAVLLKEEGAHGKIEQLAKLKNIFIFSVPLLLLGLASSFVRYGSLVDYFLVTLGLSGIFYFIWKTIFEKRKWLANFIVMAGAESYSVYLVHQLILQRAGQFLGESWRLIGFVVVIIASFPIGIYLNDLVNLFVQKAKELGRQEKDIIPSVFLWIVSLGTLAASVLMEGSTPGAWSYRLLAMMAGTGLILLIVWELVRSDGIRLFDCMMHRLSVCFSILTLFVAPQSSLKIRLLFAILLTVMSCYIYFRFKKKLQSWVFGFVGAAALIAGMEIILLYANPIETGYWGELPALQIHPTRTYALKPSQRIHLKYNNYNYYVNTNSLGLNSPEIELSKPSEDTIRILVIGDAFSMPEGMEFENGYSALLEREVSKAISPRHVQVINAGVTGYGPAEEYPQLTELLPVLKPDIVIYQFFIDEFGQIVDETPSDKLASIGLTGDQNNSFNGLLQRSQVGGHLDKFVDQDLDTLFGPVREALTGKSLGWRYKKSLLKYYETGENSYYSSENMALVRSHIAAMDALCQKSGANLIIYFVPGAVEVSAPSDIAYFPSNQNLLDKSKFDLDRPYNNLVEIADKLQVPVVNLKEPLKKDPNQPVYFPESWHWNQEGHRTVAEFIALDLEKRDLLIGLREP